MIIGSGSRPVSSRTVSYRLVPSSVATPLQDRCDDVAEPLHEGLLIEHLEGQHDQSSHGSWAKAGGGGSGGGDPAVVGKLAAKFGVTTVRRPFATKGGPLLDGKGGVANPLEADALRAKWQSSFDKVHEWGTALRQLEEDRYPENSRLGDLRTQLTNLQMSGEKSQLYDPANGTLAQHIIAVEEQIAPLQAERLAIIRASAGAGLLADAMFAARQDESYYKEGGDSQPFSSFVMHPDMPNVPVAGAKGTLRMTDGVPYELDMSLFGSANMVAGSGSVVMADFLEHAADNNVPMTLIHPVGDAKMWYKNFGFTEADDGSDTMSMSAESIKSWVAAYRKARGGN